MSELTILKTCKLKYESEEIELDEAIHLLEPDYYESGTIQRFINEGEDFGFSSKYSYFEFSFSGGEDDT